MNKTTNIALLFLLVNVFLMHAQIAKQGFENKAQDNWTYTSNIPFYSKNNKTDVWLNQPGSNGRIPGPFAGSSYLAGRDLDNPYTEAYTGLASPEHILTFAPIDLSGVSAEMSFRVHYVGLNKADYIYYELRFDNATDWNYSDYKEDVFRTNKTGSFSSAGWEKIKYEVLSGHSYVRMRLVVYQNGNEYLGLDSFELKTVTLSNKYNLIEGFSFGPNPTSDVVNFKANTVLDEVLVYNVLGKEVISKKGNLKSLSLDLSHIPNGIYLAQIKSGEITQTLKLIKK